MINIFQNWSWGDPDNSIDFCSTDKSQDNSDNGDVWDDQTVDDILNGRYDWIDRIYNDE